VFSNLLDKRYVCFGLVFLHTLVAIFFMFGSWLENPTDLSGWDVERFQEIAVSDNLWSEQNPVEYPPGSVVLIEAISTDSLIDTHRLLVMFSYVVDLLIAIVLYRVWGLKSSNVYLFVSLFVLPMGLVRLDLWAVLFSVLAVAVVYKEAEIKEWFKGSIKFEVFSEVIVPLSFGLFVATGAAIKIWPGLLVVVALYLLRWRLVISSAFWLLMMGISWLFFVGNGFEPLHQVVSLRGATGWHIESIIGNLVALFSSEEPTSQLNAFRIGELNKLIVLFGRFLFIGYSILLGWNIFRNRRNIVSKKYIIQLFSVCTLGLLAALLISSPLFSPQFVLWLTPWIALIFCLESDCLENRWGRPLVTFSIAVVILTAATLALFSPPSLHMTIPATMLLVRNFCLFAVAVSAVLFLYKDFDLKKVDS